MQIEFIQTVADFRAAHRLHYRQSRWRRIHFFLVYAFVLMASVAYAGFVLFPKHSRGEVYSPSDFVILAFLLLALCGPALKYYAIGRQFNRMRPAAWRGQKVRIELNDDYVTSGIPGLAEAKYSWDSFSKFSQDEKITLLYFGAINFLFIPTTVFNPAERAELNDLVARHVVKR